LSCRNSSFAKDIGYKHIKWLFKLHTVNHRISTRGAYFKFRRRRGGAYSRRALNEGGCYFEDLGTLWKFVHAGFVKLRMLTSEIHFNSLHVSKLNSEPTALQWNTEIQLQLKISSSISCSYIWTYTCRETSVFYIRTTIKGKSSSSSLFKNTANTSGIRKILDSIIKEHKNRMC